MTSPSSSDEYVIDENVGILKGGRLPGARQYTTGGLDLEQYRVGGPGLPMLPIVVHNKHDPAIITLIKQHGVVYISIRLVRIQSRAEPSAKYHPYLLVESDWEQGCMDKWISAADAAWIQLQNYGHKEIKVLIADDRAMKSTITRTIDPQHPTLPYWPTMAREIVQAMKPNVTWLTIDLVLRGKSWRTGREADKLKVVILITWNSIESWESVITRIESQISSHELYAKWNVQLEIVRGYLFGADSDPLVNKKDGLVADNHGEAFWQETPYLGASVGPGNGDGAGTFGFRRTFADPAQEHSGDISNKDDPASIWSCDKDRGGFLYPSQQKLDAGESIPEGAMRALEHCKESVAHFESLEARALQKLEQPFGLGPVKAFSSFQKDPNNDMILDWALIELPTSTDVRCNAMPRLESIYAPALANFRAHKLGEKVFKRGRRTGLTVGVICAAESVINITEIRKTFTKPANRVRPTDCDEDDEKTLSVAIAQPVQPAKPIEVFCQEGDSGAVVFDRNGQIVGLFVMGSNNLNMGYLTSTVELERDIRMVTGAKQVKVHGGYDLL
ncbi:hypothetical protein H2200_010911 [Cladophialophora chaetospira]|uniref:Uncharacterized protein n=1 Tax=Cladophialophora chaetospira TaxID=386627 RepID=A0AA38X104_9EURO|nr:hypothetical protein H2200_010911 [Cladophialophora chaetospira]